METNNRISHENDNEPKTPEEILRSTVTEFNALHKKARDALHENSDAATYELKLRERARLLVALPLKLEQAIENGETYPDAAMRDIRFFAKLATEILETNNMFGLGALLIHKGGKLGDPNDLEKIINKLYPPKQPPIGSQK